jgi:hypothetical protein
LRQGFTLSVIIFVTMCSILERTWAGADVSPHLQFALLKRPGKSLRMRYNGALFEDEWHFTVAWKQWKGLVA